MSTADALEAKLNEAAASGLERFDPGAVALVRTLVARARRSEGEAAARIARLAEDRLARALARRADDVARLTKALEELGENRDAYREALERGEPLTVARAIRRVRKGGRRLIGTPRPERDAVKEPAEPRAAPSSIAPPPASLQRYRQVAAEVEADLALARAKRSVPEVAGRYHGGVVAAEALETMERVGRGYLVAQLARFEAYEAIFALAETFDPPAPSKAKRKPKAKRR